MNFEFPRTLGQEDARERLRQALAQGRFPHALLVHGEPGLGQHALLLDLAHILSCEDATQRPCNACHACKAFQNNALENVLYLMPLVKKGKDADEDDPSEGLDSALMDELLEKIQALYASPYGFSCEDKAMVTVGQSRALIARLGYAENRQKSRMVIVPYFEALNVNAANSLLKILEEPPADVYFLIGSENRAALLPTLLSRCLHLGLSPLSSADFRAAVETLTMRGGIPLIPALLPFAEGSPGVYLELIQDGGEELLEEGLRFLSAASGASMPDWRVFADYAGQGPAAAGLEETLKLLHFLLRMVRVHETLKSKYGAKYESAQGADSPMRGSADNYRWTARALEQEGWDGSLAAYLGPFEDVADVPAFVAFLEAAHKAVKGYSKPQVALVGLFLEYESKVRLKAFKASQGASAGARAAA
jgi:DNA polymerase-3 subunit delta'